MIYPKSDVKKKSSQFLDLTVFLRKELTALVLPHIVK